MMRSRLTLILLCSVLPISLMGQANKTITLRIQRNKPTSMSGNWDSLDHYADERYTQAIVEDKKSKLIPPGIVDNTLLISQYDIGPDDESESFVTYTLDPFFSRHQAIHHGKLKRGNIGSGKGGMNPPSWSIRANDYLDLDVDSNNDGILEPDSDDEDKIEEDKPGKIFKFNSGDIDGDSVPDFIDGYDFESDSTDDDELEMDEKLFIPLKLRIKNLNDISQFDKTKVNPADVKYTFEYTASLPYLEEYGGHIKKEKIGNTQSGKDVYEYSTKQTGFRIWLKKTKKRNSDSVSNRGDFVPADSELTAADIKMDKGSHTFYIEAVPGPKKLKDAELLLTVTAKFKQRETEITFRDTIALNPIDVDIVPDWDRNGVIDAEDEDKVATNRPWRFWINNDDDADADAETGLPNKLEMIEPFSSNDDLPGQFNKDYTDSKVNGIRDFIDFFPVYIDVKDALELLPSDKYVYSLSQSDVSLKGFATNFPLNKVNQYLEIEKSRELKNQKLKPIKKSGNGDPVFLTDDFLNKIKTENKGIIVFEGAELSSAPIMLTIRNKYTGKELLKYSFPLDIVNVTDMYSLEDLRHLVENTKPESRKASKEPFCTSLSEFDYGKCFIFIHGYNVSRDGAKAMSAEVYKRMFQTEGFKGTFIAINWTGDPDTSGPTLVTHYHQAMVNAFGSAKGLADYINDIKDEKYILAHSAGNMLASIAINDYKLKFTKYFAMDAAVSLEAYGDIILPSSFRVSDGSGGHKLSNVDSACMVKVAGWEKYVIAGQDRLLPSEWHELFKPSGSIQELTLDKRQLLTWRNRLSSVPSGSVYNFHSTTEDVLGAYDGEEIDDNLIDNTWNNKHCWVLQEKYKGRELLKNAGGLSSPFMGYNYNTHDYVKYDILHPAGRKYTPTEAAAEITDDMLKTKPFFTLYDAWGFDNAAIAAEMAKLSQDKLIANAFLESLIKDTALKNYYTDNSKIQDKVTVRDFLLCEAIPATTLPMGLKENRHEDMSGNNFDMLTEFATDKDKWPVKQKYNGSSNPISVWRHSDFKEVPYQHTRKLYEKFVNLMK